MRTFYIPVSGEGYELCQPARAGDFERLNVQIDGTSRARDWVPVEVQLICEDDGVPLVESDSPWLGSHALIFRASAADRCGSMLRKHGELLPLDCPGARLSVFNPTKVVDALDEDGSSLSRFSSGRIMSIERYRFRQHPIAHLDIFKIPSLRVSPTFVSDRFVQRWISHGLLGLEFEPVWSG